jgi:hypothetical protein
VHRRYKGGKWLGKEVTEGCRGAEHGQACTKDGTGAVAVRAALALAVQLGRSEQASQNSQAYKCRDVLQIHCPGQMHLQTWSSPAVPQLCPLQGTVEMR